MRLLEGSSTPSGVAAFPFADGRPIVPVGVLVDIDAGKDRGSPKNLASFYERARRTGVYQSETDEIHFVPKLEEVGVGFIPPVLQVYHRGRSTSTEVSIMGQQRKTEVRREMRTVLANLDKRWEMAAHGELCAHLSRLIQLCSKEPIKHILAWVPCFPGEVDLAGFIGEMLRSRAVYLPRVEDAGVMTFHRIDDEWASRLETTPRGILQPEPGYGEEFDADEAEGVAIISPGLAFDRNGRRLGRGRGYYDRYLADPRLGDAIRIGVCWSMQLLREIPVDQHDIPMDWICHERGVIVVASGGAV